MDEDHIKIAVYDAWKRKHDGPKYEVVNTIEDEKRVTIIIKTT